MTFPVLIYLHSEEYLPLLVGHDMREFLLIGYIMPLSEDGTSG